MKVLMFENGKLCEFECSFTKGLEGHDGSLSSSVNLPSGSFIATEASALMSNENQFYGWASAEQGQREHGFVVSHVTGEELVDIGKMNALLPYGAYVITEDGFELGVDSFRNLNCEDMTFSSLLEIDPHGRFYITANTVDLFRMLADGKTSREAFNLALDMGGIFLETGNDESNTFNFADDSRITFWSNLTHFDSQARYASCVMRSPYKSAAVQNLELAMQAHHQKRAGNSEVKCDVKA